MGGQRLAKMCCTKAEKIWNYMSTFSAITCFHPSKITLALVTHGAYGLNCLIFHVLNMMQWKYIVPCQVHPALVKWSRVTRFYVNVSWSIHLSVSSRNPVTMPPVNPQINLTLGSGPVSCRRRGDGFYWRPRLPGTRQYNKNWLQNLSLCPFGHLASTVKRLYLGFCLECVW